ncbi:MAG: hypothetical protein ACLS9K_07645 [Lachnospira eligens]
MGKRRQFSDIGVIEELSRILDIRIQDIVIGEIKEKNTDSETAVTEVVRVAKLQDRVKKRELIQNCCCYYCWIYAYVWVVLIQGTY